MFPASLSLFPILASTFREPSSIGTASSQYRVQSPPLCEWIRSVGLRWCVCLCRNNWLVWLVVFPVVISRNIYLGRWVCGLCLVNQGMSVVWSGFCNNMVLFVRRLDCSVTVLSPRFPSNKALTCWETYIKVSHSLHLLSVFWEIITFRVCCYAPVVLVGKYSK